MFEQWLTVAYKHDQEKTASRQFLNRLHALPIEELRKAAAGDPTSKLAYVDGPSDERDSWIGKYKGSPLFQKAVELEKALLQIDMEENQRRAEENAEPKASSDSYERKDAIKLQQRMLDLDLAMEGAGAENPEAKEEEGVQLLEQAQQQEAAAGEGNEPHEKAEDAAIQQFRGAQQQEAAAPAKTEVKVGEANEHHTRNAVARTVGGAGLGGTLGYIGASALKKKPGAATAIGAGLGGLAGLAGGPRKEKTAGTLGSDTRRVATSTNNEVLHGGSTQGAGALGDFQPTTDDHLSNVSEGLQVNKTAAAHSLTDIDTTGRILAKMAAALTEGQREHISMNNFALPHGGPNGKPAYPVEDPKHARLAVSMVDTHGSPSEKSKVHALVAKKYPALAARSSVPDVAEKGHKALSKAAEANKEAGIGASLATAGQKALTAGKGMLASAGGVSGLASKGLGLAKANPLATAGIAGAAGLAGGAMLGHHKQAALDLNSLKKGVATAPLG